VGKIFQIHRDRFPNAFGYLASALPKLPADQPDVWREFKHQANLSEDEANSAVTFNDRPPVIFASNLSSSTWSQFDPAVPGRIELSLDVLERFESVSADADARKFLLAKFLHELCHWGCFLKHIPDDDNAGEAFEQAVFGKELLPWWNPTDSDGLALAAADEGLFLDADARAKECRRMRMLGQYMPGRLSDPSRRVFGGVDAAESLPRGYRNNNPGNIRKSALAWEGLSDPAIMRTYQRNESSFCVFMEPEWGIRAMALLLRTYKHKHGLKTPHAIISRWAPVGDNNDVESYSAALAAALGVTRDTTIDVDVDSTAVAVIKSMAKHENGVKVPYSDVQFAAAMKLAK
jgi:hypothetical protein